MGFFDIFGVDNSSRASDPGATKIKLLPSIWYLRKEYFWVFAITAFFIYLAFSSSIFWALGAALPLYWAYRRYISLGQYLQMGCKNEAVLIATNPNLLAVYTDLGNRGDNFYYIKIVKFPANKIAGKPIKVGMRVAVVSTYEDHGFEGRWGDFNPIPITLVNPTAEASEKALANSTPEDWQEFDEKIQRIPRPFRPGLYPVD